MLSTMLNGHPPSPSAAPNAPSSRPTSPSKSPSKTTALLSPRPNGGISPSKRPRSSHSPMHQDRSAPSTPARTAIGALVNARDEPPRSAAATPSADARDEADVAMQMDEIIVDEEPDEEMDAGEGEDDEEDEDEEEEEDDEDSEEDSDGDESEDDIVVLDGPTGATGPGVEAVKVEPTDPSATEAAPKPDDEVNVLKPKKKRAKRSPSSDEDLPPPPPPMPTIRLEVSMGTDGEELDWNFAEAAAHAGYNVLNAWGEDPLAGEAEPEVAADEPPSAPAEPLVIPPGMSAAEAQEMADIARRLEEKYDKPVKRGKIRKRRVVEYDLADPFIDDSDLQIDAPTHIARPKKEGFFVHQGPLELMEGSPAKRSRSSKPKTGKRDPREPRKSLSAAVRERVERSALGDADAPIDVDEDDFPHVKYDRRSPSPPEAPEDRYPIDRTLFKNAAREEKYLPPFDEFPDEVAHRLRQLRRESNQHKWDTNNKGKFPDHLKKNLQLASEAAMHHDLLCIVEKDMTDSGYERYKEKAFVTALCSILPYNKLTLGKLALKLCYHDYWRWLAACEAEGLRQWRELLEPELVPMREAYATLEAEWRRKQEDASEIVDDEGKKPDPPKRVPAFTTAMRDIFRQLVENTQEMVDVNKKMEEWGQRIEGQSSELNMRKALYNKIIALYPDDFMTSLSLSRQFTNYKRSGQGAAKNIQEANA